MMKRTICCLLAAITLTATAQIKDRSGVKDVNQVVDNTPDSIAKAMTARPVPGSSRRGNNPVLFLIGNSTMRTGTLGNGNNGQWGWGYYAHEYFDPTKITVENQALGGMSSRTFYNKLWEPIRQAIRPGDWVIISIGHNDNGPYDEGRARASIPGTGDDTLHVTIKETGEREIVYTYGGYMRKYINDVRAQGGHPILMSLTPRNAYDENGKIVRKPHTQWLVQVAAEEGVPFVDLNEISGQKLDSYGKWKTDYHFFLDKIHTSRFGAMMNARSAAEGLMASHNPALAPLKAMMHNVQLPAYELTRTDCVPHSDLQVREELIANSQKDMFRMVSRLRVPYIYMSHKSNIKDILMNCAETVDMLRTMGQKDIIIDPGFGFGKTVEENYEVMSGLERLQMLKLPVLVALSRKSMIYRLLGTSQEEALTGTIVLDTIALMKGANILRVHDVREAVECVKIVAAAKPQLTKSDE